MEMQQKIETLLPDKLCSASEEWIGTEFKSSNSPVDSPVLKRNLSHLHLFPNSSTNLIAQMAILTLLPGPALVFLCNYARYLHLY